MPEAIVFQREREYCHCFLEAGCSILIRLHVKPGMKIVQTPPALLLFAMIFFSSCIESTYFHSPVQGNSASYRAMPVASDSMKSATYVSGSISIGGMNEFWRDGVYKFQAGLHRSHVLDNFRLSYGASMVAGSYHVKPYFDYNGNYIDASRNAGSKFFGAWGLYGGVSAAKPLGRRGEWRYIGIEGSLYNEFGAYADFRQQLPDSSAQEIDRKKYLGAIGLNTEIVFKGRSLNKFGIKIAAGSFLRRLHYNYPASSSYYHHSHDDLIYISNTYHFTVRKTTAWFQLNLATHAAHFQFGLNYRL